MKAIQITAPSEMKVVDIEKPVLEPGEVLVKIKYVGFCGSDLNTFLGRNPMVKLPVIPGHEVGAVIEAVGKDVPDSLKPGMSVTVNPYTNCGKCASCRNGRVNACEHNETLGVQRNGAMCEYIALPWSKIIPAHRIPPRDCALIEPMSVGFHAVSRAQVTDIDSDGHWLRNDRYGSYCTFSSSRSYRYRCRPGRREIGTCQTDRCSPYHQFHDRKCT